MNEPRIPSDRVPLVERDPQSGNLLITRPWFLYLQAQQTTSVQLRNELAAAVIRIQAIETFLGI